MLNEKRYLEIKEQVEKKTEELAELAKELFGIKNPGRYVKDQQERILKASQVLYSIGEYGEGDQRVFIPRQDPETKGYFYFERAPKNRISSHIYSDEQRMGEAIECVHSFLHTQSHSNATLRKAFPLKRYPTPDARTIYDVGAIAISEVDYYAVLSMATMIMDNYYSDI